MYVRVIHLLVYCNQWKGLDLYVTSKVMQLRHLVNLLFNLKVQLPFGS